MDASKEKDLLQEIESLKKKLALSRKKNALIPEYLAGLSHDIRTPVNALMGFSSLLTESEYDDTQVKFYSQMISRSSKKLFQTISSLIDYAKIETGNSRIAMEDVSVFDLFDDLKMELAEDISLYEKENILLSFEAPKNGSGNILTDRAKLQQILKICLDNSLKYTKEGKIQVLTSIEQGERIRFTITDTGKGIDPTTRNDLFRLFSGQQLGCGEKIKSRGLPLLIAKKYTEMLQGEITVQSELHKGTSVTLILPYWRLPR